MTTVSEEIDVLLEPLVKQLKDLWYDGVMVKDGFDGEVFNMRVSLKWTMDDFRAYGNRNKQGPKIGGGANNMTKVFTMHQLQFEEESVDELENKADLFELDYLKDFAFRINKEPQICISEKFQMMMCGGSGSRIQIAAKGIIQDVDEEYFTILGHIMKEHVIWRKENDENLKKDASLKNNDNMDEEGWVDIHLIAGFNR
ncbi:hypothetical protein FRX31_015947, partial [Thalictrum thalictroides]